MAEKLRDYQIKGPDGKWYTTQAREGATDEDITNAASKNAIPVVPAEGTPSEMSENAKSFPAGVIAGGAGLAGAPGDIANAVGIEGVPRGLTSQGMYDKATKATGVDPDAKGNFGFFLGSTVPNLIGGPEAVGTKLLERMVAPAAAMTAVSSATKAVPEPYRSGAVAAADIAAPFIARKMLPKAATTEALLARAALEKKGVTKESIPAGVYSGNQKSSAIEKKLDPSLYTDFAQDLKTAKVGPRSAASKAVSPLMPKTGANPALWSDRSAQALPMLGIAASKYFGMPESIVTGYLGAHAVKEMGGPMIDSLQRGATTSPLAQYLRRGATDMSTKMLGPRVQPSVPQDARAALIRALTAPTQRSQPSE